MAAATAGLLAGAAIAGPVLGGLIGQQASAANRAAAQQAAQDAYNEIVHLNAPPDQTAAIILKHFQQAGLYTPGLEHQISAGISRASLTPTNTVGRQAQVGALGQMQERANTGYNAQDRSELNDILTQTGSALQGRLGAISQAAQARGQAGGGSELAQQLSAASSAGSDASNQSLKTAAEGGQKALQAAAMSGQMGGQLSAEDFSQAQAKAQAADRFKQFDVQNSLAQQQRNVAAQNQGQLYNLSEQQRLSDTNTQMDNAEKMRQTAAQRQYWQDQAQLAGMKSNARLGQASNLQQQANQQAGMWQGIGAGIGSGAGAALGYMGKTGGASPTSAYSPTSTDTMASGGGKAAGGDYMKFAEGGVVPGGIQDTSSYDIPNLSQEMPDKQITREPVKEKKTSPGAWGTPGYSEGGSVSPIESFLNGGTVPGKAKVKGDSKKNDTVEAKLSPGEAVLPRTVMELGPAAAYGFVHALTKHKDNK